MFENAKEMFGMKHEEYHDNCNTWVDPPKDANEENHTVV